MLTTRQCGVIWELFIIWFSLGRISRGTLVLKADHPSRCVCLDPKSWGEKDLDGTLGYWFIEHYGLERVRLKFVHYPCASFDLCMNSRSTLYWHCNYWLHLVCFPFRMHTCRGNSGPDFVYASDMNLSWHYYCTLLCLNVMQTVITIICKCCFCVAGHALW